MTSDDEHEMREMVRQELAPLAASLQKQQQQIENVAGLINTCVTLLMQFEGRTRANGHHTN